MVFQPVITPLNIQRTPVPVSTSFVNIFLKFLQFPRSVYLCVSCVWKNRVNCFSTHQFNPLTPNDHYRGRTAPLTSKRFILYIYSTNIGTDYFKHGINSPFFFSSKCSLFHNSNIFGSCFIHILYTECAKI